MLPIKKDRGRASLFMGKKRQLIQFEIAEKSFAVDAAELAGVASGCPFVSYPGLPAGVCGIVQWSGRIFPVISPFEDDAVNGADFTFLFSLEARDEPFAEVAIAVPAKVKAWFPEDEEVDGTTQLLEVESLVAEALAKKAKKGARDAA